MCPHAAMYICLLAAGKVPAHVAAAAAAPHKLTMAEAHKALQTAVTKHHISPLQVLSLLALIAQHSTTNTDAAALHVLSLLALLAQKFKYCRSSSADC